MNKKGQSVITVFFMLIVGVIAYVFVLGDWLNQITNDAVESLGLTGIEAFLMHNLDFILLLVALIFILSFFTIGGNH